MALSIGFRILSFLPSCYSSYGAWTLTPVGLSPTVHASLRWTHTFHYSMRNSLPRNSSGKPAVVILAFTYALLLVATEAMLAGAGVTTQPSLQASKGLHGSTLFTLSLPVSRLRLLATRAAIGWLEVAAIISILCCGFWSVSPLVRAVATPIEMVEYAATLLACGSALYGLSVLLATFLDDQWRTWGTLIAGGALAGLSSRNLLKLVPVFG